MNRLKKRDNLISCSTQTYNSNSIQTIKENNIISYKNLKLKLPKLITTNKINNFISFLFNGKKILTPNLPKDKQFTIIQSYNYLSPRIINRLCIKPNISNLSLKPNLAGRQIPNIKRTFTNVHSEPKQGYLRKQNFEHKNLKHKLHNLFSNQVNDKLSCIRKFLYKKLTPMSLIDTKDNIEYRNLNLEKRKSFINGNIKTIDSFRNKLNNYKCSVVIKNDLNDQKNKVKIKKINSLNLVNKLNNLDFKL